LTEKPLQPEIIDAESEPVPPQPRKTRRLLPVVLVFVVVLVAGGGALWPRLQPLLQRAPAAPVVAYAEAQEVVALNQRVDDLTRRLSVFAEARPDPADRLARIEVRLAELNRALEQRNRDDPTLTARLAALERSLAELVEARARAAAEGRATAFVLAIGQLREAALSGRPYRPALGALGQLAPDVQIAPVLVLGADQGLPTRATLTATFTALPDRLARPVSDGTSWWSDVRAWAGGLVKVRRTGDVAGTDAEAVGARAEAAVQRGDLAAAIAALKTLPPDQAALAADWVAAAELRLAAETALDDLQRIAIDRLGRDGAAAP